MESLYITIGILAGAFVMFLIFVARRKPSTPPANQEQNQGMQLLMQQLHELQRTVDQKLGDSEKSLRESLQFQSRESNRVIADITERLTRLDETNKQVVSFTEELAQLQDILKNPKQRGILGEYYLETLLKNVLPPSSYQMQYAFKDGSIVDAVIFVKEKIIPVDSKFSLENYNRLFEEKNPVERERLEKLFVANLKERIVETAQYIKPEEGTMDFAFMFIPHEAIYYDLLVNKIGALKEDTENLIQRAAGKYRVIIVSPTSFLAYLQTVLQGLKALQIEESAKEIRTRVDELGRHLKSYEDYHNRLGNSLRTVVNHYSASGRELKKMDKDVVRITGSSPGLLPETVSLEDDPLDS